MKSVFEALSTVLTIYFDARIRAAPTFDDHRFPSRALFIDNWKSFADEASSLIRDTENVPTFESVMREQGYLSRYGGKDWRLFVVKAYGHLVAKNAEQAPALRSALIQAPEVLSAAYSFIPGGKTIPFHRGPFRGIFRYYLGLIVPVHADGSPATLLKIGAVDYRLHAGKGLLWDDTYPHMVVNEGTASRVALLLDVKRDGLPWDASLVSRAVVAAAGLVARKRFS